MLIKALLGFLLTLDVILLFIVALELRAMRDALVMLTARPLPVVNPPGPPLSSVMSIGEAQEQPIPDPHQHG